MGKFQTVLKKDINELPKTAGVYLFYGSTGSPRVKKKEIIYIGKAINIKERVKNHFLQPTYKDNFFIGKTTSIGFIETGSEIEALVLEASLIKKHLPKFNQVWRDDKNYFYVAIASGRRLTQKNTQTYADKLPYIFITHQPRKSNVKGKLPVRQPARAQHAGGSPLPVRDTQTGGAGGSNVIYIGPFTEGNALKKTLKYLRRVFPYYTTSSHPKNNCTWCHLGLCPGPVRNSPPKGPLGARFRAGVVSKGAGPILNLPKYKKNLKKLTLILEGKRKTALYALRKEMEAFSKQNKFEGALEIRDKILALEQVMAHTHVIGNQQTLEGPTLQDLGGSDPHWLKTQKLLQGILNVKNPISKIECYDISNIQGTQAVGSMVVFANGRPDKSQYKKFRIRMENKPNDIAMLGEVLTRRLKHPEWGYPEVMLIDGGIAQLNVGIKAKKEILLNSTIVKNRRKINNIKIISIAKGKRELLVEDQKKHIPLKNLPQDIYNLIVHLDDEAHRFAITYHKKLRKKALGLDKVL